MTVSEAKRPRDAERSRRAILDAAERLFAQHGYHATSLGDIGDAAGVSRGTPSYFFGSKDGLYRAVLERSFAEMAAALRRIRTSAVELGEDENEGLRREIEGYIDYLLAHPDLVRLIQWEALTGGRVLGEFGPTHALTYDALAEMEGRMDGDDAPDDEALHLMLDILAMCWYPIAHKDTLMRVLRQDPLDPGFVAARKRHIVERALAALGEQRALN